MTTIQISVTADDINAGIKNHCSKCPVALAVCRHLPMTEEVTSVSVWLGDDKAIDLPATARNFIRAFDAGERVEPIIFELEVAE